MHWMWFFRLPGCARVLHFLKCSNDLRISDLYFLLQSALLRPFLSFNNCGLSSCVVVGEHPVTSRGGGADSAVIPAVRVLLRSGRSVLYSVVARVQERGHHSVHTNRGDEVYRFIILI